MIPTFVNWPFRHQILTFLKSLDTYIRSLERLLKHCETRARNQPSNTRALLQPIVVTELWECIQIDLIDIDPEFKWILHLQDHFNKFPTIFQCLVQFMLMYVLCICTIIISSEIPTFGKHILGEAGILHSRRSLLVSSSWVENFQQHLGSDVAASIPFALRLYQQDWFSRQNHRF